MRKKLTKPVEKESVFENQRFCRTRQMGKLASLGACLATEPGGCKYSIPAIGGTFCNYKK
jgi:hypothetical protein